MNQIQLATVIATSAHGGAGQMRADGKTPYITHPLRVMELVRYIWPTGEPFLEEASAAALLHDVIEDTALKFIDLINMGVNPVTLRIVDKLTKPDTTAKAASAANEGYYERIKADPQALLVKCADRCANLETVVEDIERGEGFIGERAASYASDSRKHILSMYEPGTLPYEMLESRIDAVKAALKKVAGDAPAVKT